jgi:hypothetical protein
MNKPNAETIEKEQSATPVATIEITPLRKAQNKYADNLKGGNSYNLLLVFRMTKVADAKLTQHLDAQKNRTDYIKRLIAADIKRQRDKERRIARAQERAAAQIALFDPQALPVELAAENFNLVKTP